MAGDGNVTSIPGRMLNSSMNALLNFLTDRRTRLVLAWLLLAGAVGQRA